MIFSKRLILMLATSLMFLPSHGYTASDTPGDIRFGSVAMDTPAVMHKRLTPLTEYLSKKMNRPVTLKLSADMKSAIHSVSKGEVELAYLTPVAYIRAHAKGGSQIIAKTITNKKKSFQLMIVVREDSPIQTVDELAGKRFAFGDPAALLQRAAVVGSGMPLDKLGKHEFIGHYDNIARGVMRGIYDAGILKDTTAFKWKGKGLRILYSTPNLPPYNIAASGKLDSETVAKLTDAFLSLDITNPQHYQIVKGLDKKYDGFAATSDAEYDVVRQLVRPFEK